MNIITWLSSHWTEIVAAAGGLIIAARLIVKLTPTPADDTFLESVVGVLKNIGLHIDKKEP